MAPRGSRQREPIAGRGVVVSDMGQGLTITLQATAGGGVT